MMSGPVDLSPRDAPASAGRVYWILGLPGSAKTAVIATLSARLSHLGRSVANLRVDRLRQTFSAPSLGHQLDPPRLTRIYGELSKDIAARGADVVCATTGLVHEAQVWNRLNIPRYKEIYVGAPRDSLARRDAVRRRPAVGQTHPGPLTSADFPADASIASDPIAPDIVIDDDGALNAEDVALELFRHLRLPLKAA